LAKPVIVTGYEGNMGRRYTTILDYLGIPWYGIEYGYRVWDGVKKEQISELPCAVDYHSIIIATPTGSHLADIKKYKHLNIPMLCEKPVCMNLDDIAFIKETGVTIKMINQYEQLTGVSGESSYNYYKSGGDGLEWDCINIIGLSTTPPVLLNSSPVWSCTLNDKKLSIADMDQAYIDMIKEWIKKPKGDLDYIEHATKRVINRWFTHETSHNNSSSEIDIDETTEQSTEGDNEKDSSPKSARKLPKKRGVSSRAKQS
jgi:hypothetical protein